MQEKNHVFRPSIITFPTVFGGHLQTIMTEIKDEYINLAFREQFDFKYDRQEVFKFKDGGETFIDYKLHDDLDTFDKDFSRDLLFLFSGQVGSNQSLYLKNMMKEAYEDRRYNIVMISFRG